MSTEHFLRDKRFCKGPPRIFVTAVPFNTNMAQETTATASCGCNRSKSGDWIQCSKRICNNWFCGAHLRKRDSLTWDQYFKLKDDDSTEILCLDHVLYEQRRLASTLKGLNPDEQNVDDDRGDDDRGDDDHDHRNDIPKSKDKKVANSEKDDESTEELLDKSSETKPEIKPKDTMNDLNDIPGSKSGIWYDEPPVK